LGAVCKVLRKLKLGGFSLSEIRDAGRRDGEAEPGQQPRLEEREALGSRRIGPRGRGAGDHKAGISEHPARVVFVLRRDEGITE